MNILKIKYRDKIEKLSNNELSELFKKQPKNFLYTKEWKTLRYGYILGLLDQDLDGFNIFGLIITFIMTHWPALISRNFVRRINTPVIRYYPKNKNKTVKEFFTPLYLES